MTVNEEGVNDGLKKRMRVKFAQNFVNASKLIDPTAGAHPLTSLCVREKKS